MNRDRARGVLARAKSAPDREHGRATSPGRQGSRKSPMLGGTLRITNVRRKRFAVIWALAAVVYLAAAAQSAWATTSLTGEGLTGAGTSTGGSAFGSCNYRASESGSMGFSVSGSATGPTIPARFRRRGVSRCRHPQPALEDPLQRRVHDQVGQHEDHGQLRQPEQRVVGRGLHLQQRWRGGGL